jgi:hypothetical protein
MTTPQWLQENTESSKKINMKIKRFGFIIVFIIIINVYFYYKYSHSIQGIVEVRLQRFKKYHMNHEEEKREKKVSKILLVTSHRSGSTFVGELFNKNPDAFYIFEPLALIQESFKIIDTQ